MNLKELSNFGHLADMASLSASQNPLGLGRCSLQMECEGDSATHKTIHFKCYIPQPRPYEYCFRIDLAGNHFKEGENERLHDDLSKYLKAIKKWLKEKPVTKGRASKSLPTNLEKVVDEWFEQNPQYVRYDLDDLLDENNAATPFLLSLISEGKI